jgi:putative Mg2+ transporter-C (MgtC) family protein
MPTFLDPGGQGFVQFVELLLAFVLSAMVGLEREIRQKSAGLRTYTLVGVSAALFMLVSKYGFSDVLVAQRVVLDPSRVAAQIVSGIGFIGGGVIFMRRDMVRGLTTAASVWLTAALGMACGAGLPVLAVTTTAIHFIIMLGFPRIVAYLPRAKRTATRIRICYQDGRGLLRDILVVCTQLRFAIDHVDVERKQAAVDVAEAAQDAADFEKTDAAIPAKGLVYLSLQVRGKRPISHLIASLSDIDGVVQVGSLSDDTDLE